MGTWYPHPRSGGVFTYDTNWVVNGYALSPTFPLVTGAQPLVAEAGRIPQVFSDSAPDRWGKGVIQRAWQNEGRGKPSDIDCLLAVNDRLRMGALRYTHDGEHLDTSSRIPKMLDLERLEAATRRTENDLDDDEDIAVLFNAGSSLGGARPKAVIVDEHGHLMLAKFTSTKDTAETIAWEKVCLDIAARSGIRTPRSKLLRIANRPVLVMDRFDREYTNDGAEHRIGYMSAMTLVDETIATLAQRAGVGPLFIESFEAAEHRPELAKVLAVLDALDIEPRAIPTPHPWTAGPDPDGTSHKL